MPYQLALTTAPTGGVLIADLTPFVTSCTISTNEHGPQELRATVPRSLYDAFRVYDAPGTLHVQLNDGAWPLWVGRLEEPGLRAGAGGALEINAFGYWRALSDLPYTALWSDTSLERMVPVQTTQINNRTPERYEIAFDNSTLQIAPKKGETFGGNGGPAPQPAIGAVFYIPPNGGSRQITLVQFDLSLNVDASWRFICYRVNNALTVFNSVFSITSGGAALTRSIFTSITADDRLMFELYLDTAGTAVAAFDTGTKYARITNFRVCSSIADIANTALTVNRNAGASVTATVGSTANMYVGQRLTINSAGSPSESVLVEQVTSSTQFVATFLNNYTAGQPVGGSRIDADTIVADLVTTVAATNTTQLQSTSSLITSPNRDIADAVYEDQYPADIITALCQQGDSTGAQFEAGVDAARRVYFRQVGSQARRWYVDVADLQLNRSLDGLRNSAYTVYADASGTPVRTASATNAASVVRYGLTRRQAVALQTTNSTYATAVRDAEVAANALVQPRAAFTVRQVYDANSARAPLAYVQAGDYLVLRNLPPTASNAIDSIRTFRITRTEYDPFSDSLSIEPEAPATTLDALVGGQL